MSRDQRMRDNWALLHALEEAGKRSAPAAVAFNLVRRRRRRARGRRPRTSHRM
jgi:deoxyribodipyrimidine photolyase